MQLTGNDRFQIMTALALLIVLLCGCATAAPPVDAVPRPASTDNKSFDLPSLRLPTPTNARHQSYLGVGPAETFALADIQTSILIIEVFNFYCPHCQKEAPNINRLFERIENDPQLKGRIKIIGIGIGNTPYEVSAFRNSYAIPFPLFADRSRVLSKHLEVRRTPTFIGWGYKTSGRIEPFLFAPGAIGEVETFLQRVAHDSGIELF